LLKRGEYAVDDRTARFQEEIPLVRELVARGAIEIR
jgi:hypothetical protein